MKNDHLEMMDDVKTLGKSTTSEQTIIRNGQVLYGEENEKPYNSAQIKTRKQRQKMVTFKDH